ncbi:hypothetical protein JR316_0010801 [Psilocybe cubensis]|uniref:Uncharacterized protein n=2 Tax=Psilocybe cubensis TaxID=181762 RepID=A0A8H7XXB9_PSICU|nr:hypothetical protein JR316_0010801 [Psilocybe cubensis]KAH9476885.1 hypothetical protein JR316_0010801 [Psilocybe cubensis]
MKFFAFVFVSALASVSQVMAVPAAAGALTQCGGPDHIACATNFTCCGPFDSDGFGTFQFKGCCDHQRPIALQKSPDAACGCHMLAAPLHIGKVAFRASIRNHSNLAHGYVASASKNWRTPVWNLVNALKDPHNPEQIHDILRDNQLTVKQFEHWENVLRQPNLTQAIQVLQNYKDKVDGTGSANNSSTNFPPWVLLSIVAYVVKTPEDASGPLMDLVFENLNSVAPEFQAPLLILTANQLAQHNLLVQFRRVLDAFLVAPIPERHQKAQFNYLLRALSRMPFRSGEGSTMAMEILEVMDERTLQVAPSTYHILLHEDFASLHLARQLFVRIMTQENFQPPAKLLEAFLRLLTKHNRGDLALKFYDAIQRVIDSAPPGSEDANDAYNTRTRARTIMLNFFNKRSDAKQFLHSLSSLPTSRPRSTPIDPTHAPYNESSALNIASKDSTVTINRFIKIFLSLPTKPTIVTYTILIRGLLARRAYPQAEIWWQKLVKQSTITMDAYALVAGVQALIRNGKPHEAFMYLEKYAKKPPGYHRQVSPSVSESESSTSAPSTLAPGENSVVLTTVSVNDILVALNRISRPDVVFRLFTHMNVLYGTQPNSATLSILLQAARQAVQIDDADVLAGVFGKMKLLDPFKRTRFLLSSKRGKEHEHAQSEKDEAVKVRADAVNDILSCVGHPSRGGLRRYVNGSHWMGVEAVEFGRRTFLQALFGRAVASGKATYERVLRTESPAAAIRESYDAPPPTFIRAAPKPYVFVPPDTIKAVSKASSKLKDDPSQWSLLTSSGTSHLPSVALTNNNVLNYIQLLCVSNRVAEVPLVLAWARELGVQPSRSTLSLALVLWSEVSQMAPLVALWQKKKENKKHHDEGDADELGSSQSEMNESEAVDLEDGGEYRKFVQWVESWVGAQRMPKAEDIQKWRIVVHRMRTGSTYDAKGDGFLQPDDRLESQHE